MNKTTMKSYELLKGAVSRDIWRTFKNGLIGLGQGDQEKEKRTLEWIKWVGGGGTPTTLQEIICYKITLDISV